MRRLKKREVRRLKKSEVKKWDIGKLNKKEVKEEFIREVTCKKYSFRRSGRYK